MEPSSYTHLLEKTRLPQPSFQRLAVSTLFQKFRSAQSPLELDSNLARDALSQCLASASAPVADQAVREVCRLVKDGLLLASVALVELQSALEGCSPCFVPLFVKGIGFLVRFALSADPSWGRRFDPVELHPFVKILSSRSEVHQELIHQVLLLIVQNKSLGMEAISAFLRPFLLFSILRTPSSSYSSFTRNLISCMASLSCALSSESIGILELLVGCLKYFPHANDEECKFLLVSAEYLVDALYVVLKQTSYGEKMSCDARICCMDLLENLLTLCIMNNKPWGATETILELSTRLLVAQKELGLSYFPKLAMVSVSVSIILTQVEFEHEQLSALKLLTFLNDWKNETENSGEGITSYHGEELLCIFPLINVLSSPSGHVKASACHILLSSIGLVLGSSKDPKKVQFPPPETSYMGLGSIILRLLHHLWSEERSCSPCSFLIGYASNCNCECKEICRTTTCWTSHLEKYMSTIARRKSNPMTQLSESSLGGLSSLLSSVSSVLLLHPEHSMSAVDSLAAIGTIDPKMGMPLLLTVLFHSKMLCEEVCNGSKILPRLLEILPSLASHSIMVPLILQTMMPMLRENSELVLYGTAVRLLCKTWIVNDFAFGSLQGILEPKGFSHFISHRDICISLAASVRDVCKHNPDRGVDLILSISSSIESRDSSVHALGLESLAYLCEADVIDFYTAWDFVLDHLHDYSVDPVVARGLCILLKWGALDAEVFSEASRNIIRILWEIGTSRKGNSSWVKTRGAAFESLSHYEVSNVQESIPGFKRRNLECLVSEDNVEVLSALEKLEAKILNSEHKNRRRALKQKRVAVHKVEKLLDVLPQAIFSPGKLEPNVLPGAALLTLDFSPKEMNAQATRKDLPKLHAAYENALLEISESLNMSRNIFIAILALQSWKPFMHHWLNAAVPVSAKSSSTFDKSSKVANDILKTLCSVAVEAIPRISSNIAFAIAALCMVLPSSAHTVVSSASDFLFKWLFEYEHEHRQWSAAISLGLVSTCFDATNRKQMSAVANGLLKVLCNSKSQLVKGACGVALGFLCQNILNRTTIGGDFGLDGESAGITETSLLQDIVGTLSFMICKLCPSTAESFNNLNDFFQFSGQSMSSELFLGDCNLEEDVWGIAGLVFGLGYSVVALYRFGFHDVVLKIKDILISWISYDSTRPGSLVSNELSDIALCLGSCLTLPTVAVFCQRNELANIDFDFLYGCFCTLISELLSLQKSGTAYQNLLMASCIGAGSFLSGIMNTGVHLVKFDDVKHLMEVLRTTYDFPYPLVCFGGMLGVANAFGAGAGDIIQMYPQATTLQLNNEQESTFISGPILSSPACEMLSTSIVREIFLIAKESKDQQIKKYAAWALSFLRYQWWSTEHPNMVASQINAISSNSPAQTFDEDSFVWKLSIWLRDLNKNKARDAVDANTIAAVLRCLSKAPRLPALDWGVIIRRSMIYDLQLSSEVHMGTLASVREECLNFSLSHASLISPLLGLVDDLCDLSRFRTLELNLQIFLLEHLSDICKVFSVQRMEKLFIDLAEYFGDSSSSYFAHGPEKKSLLRVSFWKGLDQCLREPSKETIIPNAEKCVGFLLSMLPLTRDGFPRERMDPVGEWSVAIRCLSEAPKKWLMNILQVPDIDQLHGESNSCVAKIISIKAQLVGRRCLTISQLAELKYQILNGKTEGVWWSMLVEVAAAVLTAEGSVKREWLLHALEVSCISEYPSTALRFVGLLSSGCSVYMPLLIADPTTVLSDMPVTLPSLISDATWSTIAGNLADKLWICTERICTWAKHSATVDTGASIHEDHIDASESSVSAFLARVMHATCLSLKEFLPLDKQMRLANLLEEDACINM